MRMHAYATIALVLLLCVTGVDASAAEPSEEVGKFLGDAALSVLKAPTKVECFRINPIINPKEAKEVKEKLHNYPVIGKGKDQDAAFAQRLAKVLLNEKTYNFETGKMCEFDPGVVFRVWKDKEFADVLLCFSCDELEVVTQAPADKPHKAHEDFDSARPALLALAKEAFPDDKEIQALKD